MGLSIILSSYKMVLWEKMYTPYLAKKILSKLHRAGTFSSPFYYLDTAVMYRSND